MMQAFEVEAPDGRKFKIEGNKMPTEQDLNNIFAQFSAAQQPHPTLPSIQLPMPESETAPTAQLTGGVEAWGGAPQYKEVMENPELTREQRAAEIERIGEAERRQIDLERNKQLAKMYTGGLLQIGSAAIPFAGGAQLGARTLGAIAPRIAAGAAQVSRPVGLTRALNQPVQQISPMAQQAITSAGRGLGAGIPSGAVFGAGQGMIEDKDLAGISGSALREAALFGTIGAGIGAVAPRVMQAATPALRKVGEKIGELKTAMQRGQKSHFDVVKDLRKAQQAEVNMTPTQAIENRQLTLFESGQPNIPQNIPIADRPRTTVPLTTKEHVGLGEKLYGRSQDAQNVSNEVRTWASNLKNKEFELNNEINLLINYTKRLGKDWGINDKQLRELMPFLREHDIANREAIRFMQEMGTPMPKIDILPENLNRPDLQRVLNKLTPEQRNKLAEVADRASHDVQKYWHEYNAAQGNVSFVELDNYIAHLWKSNDAQRMNFINTISGREQRRLIPTYEQGIEMGLVPRTLDYAEILEKQSRGLINATENQNLAVKVLNMTGADGKPLVTSGFQTGFARNLKPLKSEALGGEVFVNPDAYTALSSIFRDGSILSRELGQATRIYDKVNGFAKQAQLGFSLFHAGALAESAIGNVGLLKTASLLNPVRIINEMKTGVYGVHKNPQLTRQAVDDGLQLGAPLDINRGGIERLAEDAANWIERRAGKLVAAPARGLQKSTEKMSEFLWDNLHNNLKLETYEAFISGAAKNRQFLDTSGNVRQDVRREIAQWVNDSYGGQIWENIGLPAGSKMAESRMLLSPDWLRSTTRQALGALSSAKTQREINKLADSNWFKQKLNTWGVGAAEGTEISAAIRGQLARKFWTRSAVYSAIGWNATNAAFRAYDMEKYPELYPEEKSMNDYTLFGNAKGKQTNIFIGRTNDGRERYLRMGKQYREMPELIAKPVEKIGGKTSPMIQFASKALTGHSPSGFREREMFYQSGPKKGQMKSGYERIGEIAKLGVRTFKPFSFSSVVKDGISPTGLIAPSSKYTEWHAKQNLRNVFEQGGDSRDINAIRKEMLRGGIKKDRIETVVKSARSNFLNEYKLQFINALKQGNTEKITEIISEMKDKNISTEEILRTRQNANKKLMEQIGGNR